MADVNRDATDTAKKRAQRRFLIKFLIDDVTDGAGACELEDEGIDPGDVIWQKKEATFGQMLEADGVDAIKESDERPAKKMERALTGGHVRHRLLFTISVRTSICQSATADGNERPSRPRRPNRARAASHDQSF
jgi:hypothetical protein